LFQNLSITVLERLLYRSKATNTLGSLHLFNMLSEARSKNASLGITGHLLYTEEVFVQCIEGEPKAIESLWQSLQRDNRHKDIELLARGPLDQRRFNDWSMAFSSYPSLNRFNMPGFFAVDKEGMSAEAERCAQA
jgi:Sensors of blue-light using FAD